MWEKFHDFRGAVLWNLTIRFFGGDLDVCFAYSGVVFTKTLVGGVLPDGTQRIGEGGNRCSDAAPSSLPYPPRPPTPPSLSRLFRSLGATPEVTWLKALG